MRKFILLFLFFCPLFLLAQNLTGIWRGNFSQKEFNPISGNFTDDNYKYEVQINQKSDNSLDGVTYSYKKTEFYAKASLHGLVSPKNKNIIIKEIKLIEHHSNNSSSSTCLMTCYFDYVKRGKLEILTGTYTSINADGTKVNNCGEGTVYLEKVEESDFDEESFLSKKNHNKSAKASSNTKFNTTTKNNSTAKVNKTPDTNTKKSENTTNLNDSKSSIVKKDNTHKSIDNQLKTNKLNNSSTKGSSKVNNDKSAVVSANSKTLSEKTKARIDSAVQAIKAGKLKPGAETFVLKNKIDNEIDTFYKFKIDTTIYVYDSPNNKHAKKNKPDSSANSNFKVYPEDSKIPNLGEIQIPKPLIERENKLVNTIDVDEKEVRIDFYDNGEIDNDTISVYDNNRILVNGGRLSNSPIALNLLFSNEIPKHEIITVAENLGDIPPNTALMVVTFGKKRYEVFITSDEQRNAKVILNYKPKPQKK